MGNTAITDSPERKPKMIPRNAKASYKHWAAHLVPQLAALDVHLIPAHLGSLLQPNIQTTFHRVHCGTFYTADICAMGLRKLAVKSAWWNRFVDEGVESR